MFWDILRASAHLGAKISLAAIPYSLVYTQLRMFNFAFGEVITFGGYVIYILVEHLHWPLWSAVCAALLLSALLGVVIERTAYRRLMTTPDRHLLLVSSIGVSIALQNFYQAVFGSRTMYPTFSLDQGSCVWLVLTAELIALLWVLGRTPFGSQVAAVASNRRLAQLLGINPGFVYTTVFAIASALAVPPALIEISENGIAPDTGFQLGLLAFAAAVLGGRESLLQTAAAGFFLALLTQLAQVTGVLNERLVWVLCVIGAILFSAGRRALRHYLKIRRGEDSGE